MKKKSLWIAVGLASCIGCGSENKVNVAAAPANQKTEAENLPKVAYPEFVNWSKFPENASVKRRKVVSNTHGEVIVTTKVWLKSKSAESVTVGSQITVQRPEMPIVKNDDDFVQFPATYRLPKGLTEDQFYLPSAKAKETGTEKIKVGEREFNATIFEWTESSEAGPSSVKLWRSDEMPGRFIRQELITKGIETTSLEEVTEVEIPTDEAKPK